MAQTCRVVSPAVLGGSLAPLGILTVCELRPQVDKDLAAFCHRVRESSGNSIVYHLVRYVHATAVRFVNMATAANETASHVLKS